jgi:hypothetical protein
MPIAPWAKLMTLLARKVMTTPMASAAMTAPLPRPRTR